MPDKSLSAEQLAHFDKRLDRIAARYEQLEQELDALECRMIEPHATPTNEGDNQPITTPRRRPKPR